MKKKLDVNYYYSFAHLTIILLLHYLAKFKSRTWPFSTTNSYWVVQGSACFFETRCIYIVYT